MTPLHPRFAALLDRDELVDPQTLTPLRLSDDGAWLVNDADGVRYPVDDGIPRLLEAAAGPVPDES